MRRLKKQCILLNFGDIENIIKTKAKNENIQLVKVESYDFKALTIRIYLSKDDYAIAIKVLNSLNIEKDWSVVYSRGILSIPVEKVYEGILNEKLVTTFNDGSVVCFVLEQ